MRLQTVRAALVVSAADLISRHPFAFDALKSHVNDMQEDELLADAQFSPEGEPRSVGYHSQTSRWQRPIPRQEWQAYKIEGKQLTAEVNSKPRPKVPPAHG